MSRTREDFFSASLCFFLASYLLPWLSFLHEIISNAHLFFPCIKNSVLASSPCKHRAEALSFYAQSSLSWRHGIAYITTPQNTIRIIRHTHGYRSLSSVPTLLYPNPCCILFSFISCYLAGLLPKLLAAWKHLSFLHSLHRGWPEF